MKMTPKIFLSGTVLVWAASISIMVIFPVLFTRDQPSEIWLPISEKEKEGLKLYVNNGCSYCHSQYIRPVDWGIGAERIAQPGDYYQEYPAILGSERTGPDLSQEGGEHSDDWLIAHFVNPRYTRPVSVMPSWEFLGKDKLEKLTAYLQSLGRKEADGRVARQRYWKRIAVKAYNSDPDSNVQWIHRQVPEVWRNMPNPYPAYEADVERGKNMYQKFCIGCHGPVGDGNGPAARYLNPRPLNFTLLKRNLADGKYIGGILYYQIMNGITGTSMPYFKKDLESEKIWDISNFVAEYFIGYSDSDKEPEGIDASYEKASVKEFKNDSTGK
jgi:cytochrome c oxidase cbb3-type subunit 2/cytochrome c oxidase cbb3-type subunit I/II